MVSFDELKTFLAFFAFNPSGKALLSKDFRPDNIKKKFPSKSIFSLLDSAFQISQALEEESISEGQIYNLDFASMRIAGIFRSEGLFCLIASASASLLDIEFKLRTVMTLFLGSFADKLAKRSFRLSLSDREMFDDALETVMTGESRYMSESLKKSVDDCLFAWVTSDDAFRGACISSFTGAVIVNRMNVDILPAAVRAIRGAFAAHLEKPRYFLAVSGVSNIFVYILGEGLLLLVDADPSVPPARAVERVETKINEIKNLFS